MFQVNNLGLQDIVLLIYDNKKLDKLIKQKMKEVSKKSPGK